MKPTPTHPQKVTQPGAAPAPHGHGMTASATSFQKLTFTAIIVGSLQVSTAAHRKNSLLFSSSDTLLRYGAEEAYGSRMWPPRLLRVIATAAVMRTLTALPLRGWSRPSA